MTEAQERSIRTYVTVASNACVRAHDEVASSLVWMRGALEEAEKVAAGDRFYQGAGRGAKLDQTIRDLFHRREDLRRAIDLARDLGVDDVTADIEMGGATLAARGTINQRGT